MNNYIERAAIMHAFADHVKRSNNSDFAPAPTWNDAVQIVEDSPAADVAEVRHAKLFEIREPIDGKPTWYRKHLCCDKCGTEIRLESWTEKRCFGAGTILRENAMPNYCPMCGAKLDGGADDAAD